MRPTIETTIRGLTLLAMAAAVAGCGGSDEGAAPANAAAAEPAAPGGERVFEREQIRGDGCVEMTAADVAAAAGVDVAQVAENPALDCLFSWPGGSARVASTVHRSVERARQHYATFTEDVTAEEMRQGKEELQERLDETAAAGEISESDAEIGGAVAGAMPERDVTHQPLAGLGNEASRDERGAVMARVGNLTFQLAAERGDAMDPQLGEQLARRVASNLAGL